MWGLRHLKSALFWCNGPQGACRDIREALLKESVTLLLGKFIFDVL